MASRAVPAVAVLFLMHGILTGGWVPHVALAKERLGVGTGLFGWILLALAAGGVVAMPLTGALIGRFGSATLCRASGLLMCLGFALPVYASTASGLAAGLFVFGTALGSLDVAMNAHGVVVERRAGRPIMSAFHGWFSVGAAAGAGAGGLVVEAGGADAHVMLSVPLALAMLGFSCRRLLSSGVDGGSAGSTFAPPTQATILLGGMAFLALFVEGAMLDWSALHLRDNLGAPLAHAGGGFAAFASGMAASRFLGNGLRRRLGAARLVRASALAQGAGLALALATPDPVVAVAALGLAGLGVGNIAPVLFAGGARVEPAAPGRGIAAVATMGYSGFLVGPPFIGMAAEWTGLQGALALTVLASLTIAAAAPAAGVADNNLCPVNTELR